MEMPRPSGGKKKNALLSILRPKPCFFGEWNPFELRIYPCFGMISSPHVLNFSTTPKSCCFWEFLQEPLPQCWGKPMGKTHQAGPPPWLRKPVPSPEISRSFIAKKMPPFWRSLGIPKISKHTNII